MWPAALADLPYLPEDAPRHLLISDMVVQVAEIADEFEQAVASLGWTGGPIGLLDELASGGALAYLRNADDGGAIGLLHAVTAPLACELVLPWLAVEDRDAALGYVWQAVAALHVAYDIDRTSDLTERDDPLGRRAGRAGAGLGRRARHQADRSGAAELRPQRRSRPPVRRRPTPAPDSPAEAGARGGPPGPWLRSARWSTAPSAGPASRSARSVWGR